MMFILLVAFAIGASSAVPVENRDSKSLALFSVVTFDNDECQGISDADSRGVCFSSTECSNKGGVKDGNCAAGFGVCCTFVIDSTGGGEVSQNVSFVQNNKFPSTVTTASKTTTYTIKPVSKEICQIRFDFIRLTLFQDTTTFMCKDTLTITGPTGVSPPVICTTTTKAFHLYSENGGSTTSTTLAVVTDTDTTGRTWKVKISQIECSNPNKPPQECGQWYENPTGSIETLGFPSGLQVPAMNYAICIKEHTGMCTTRLSVDGSITTPAPFSFNGNGGIDSAGVGATCSTGALSIPSAFAMSTSTGGPAYANRFCGTKLNTVDANTSNGVVVFTRPFKILVLTTLGGAATDAGAALVYSQIGC